MIITKNCMETTIGYTWPFTSKWDIGTDLKKSGTCHKFCVMYLVHMSNFVTCPQPVKLES